MQIQAQMCRPKRTWKCHHVGLRELAEHATKDKRQASAPEKSRCLGAAWPGVAANPASLSSLRTLACTTTPDREQKRKDFAFQC